MTKQQRKPQARTARIQQRGGNLILWLAIGKEADAYLVTPLAHQSGRAAFHLHKAYDGKHTSEEYDVLIAGRQSHCDCKGFAHRGMNIKSGNGCKHIAALTAALSAGKLQPTANTQ